MVGSIRFVVRLNADIMIEFSLSLSIAGITTALRLRARTAAQAIGTVVTD